MITRQERGEENAIKSCTGRNGDGITHMFHHKRAKDSMAWTRDAIMCR